MFSQLALAALPVFSVVHGIPVAPQQALLSAHYGQEDISPLISDVRQSNLKAAQADYMNVQKDLDDLGFYLGQLTDSTCVSTGPSASSGPAASSQDAVLAALQSMEVDFSQMVSGIGGGDKTAAIPAYIAAQQALWSTYDFIFSTTGSATSTTSTTAPTATASASVYSIIQSAQLTLNSLGNDIVASDLTTAQQDYNTALFQIQQFCSVSSSDSATCVPSGTTELTADDVLVCIHSVQLTLQSREQDSITGTPTTSDCQTAGGNLNATYSYIFQ